MEKLVLRQSGGDSEDDSSRTAAEIVRRKIARRTAAEFRDGMYINLGTYMTAVRRQNIKLYENVPACG